MHSCSALEKGIYIKNNAAVAYTGQSPQSFNLEVDYNSTIGTCYGHFLSLTPVRAFPTDQEMRSSTTNETRILM